jgi:hypothetical protein
LEVHSENFQCNKVQKRSRESTFPAKNCDLGDDFEHFDGCQEQQVFDVCTGFGAAGLTVRVLVKGSKLLGG